MTTIGLLLCAVWYAVYAFNLADIKFEDAVLGILLGIAVIASDIRKEK